MSKKNSFESQLEQLNIIVQTLEKGQLPLEDALKQFEQGIKLTRSCQTTLQDAQKKMESILSTYQIDPSSFE
jgi:exodeoxyribonuclease VII small subunit